jgi:hypothetical protein
MKIKSIKTFLAALGILSLAACEKNTLEPSKTEEPRLYFEALFNAVPFSYKAGEHTYLANAYHLLNNHDSLLIYTFTIEDYLNSSRSYIEISINNFKAPYINKDEDIDNTIKPGSFNYVGVPPIPQNPKHLSEVNINWYNDLKEKYSTNNINQKYSWFNIVSVTDTIYKGANGNVNLKKVVIDFNCLLFNSGFGDTLRLSQGRAVAIF